MQLAKLALVVAFLAIPEIALAQRDGRRPDPDPGDPPRARDTRPGDRMDPDPPSNPPRVDVRRSDFSTGGTGPAPAASARREPAARQPDPADPDVKDPPR